MAGEGCLAGNIRMMAVAYLVLSVGYENGSIEGVWVFEKEQR